MNASSRSWLTITLGVVLIGLGILANGWLLWPFLRPDIYSENEFKCLITLLDLLLIALGAILLLTRRRLALRKNLFLFCFTLLFTGVVAEFVFRCYAFGAAALSYRKMNSIYIGGWPDFFQPSPVPDLVYELKPNADALFNLIPLRTNAQGLRERDLPPAKPADTFRIAVVGDSFTFGQGVPAEQTWPRVLERLIQKTDPPRRVECLNFGVPGYCLRQYLAVLNHKILPYQPDLILIGFTANDHIHPPDRYFREPVQISAPPRPFFRLFLFSGIKQIPLYQKLTHPRLSTGLSGENRRYLAGLFEQLHQFQAQSQIPLVAVYLARPGGRPDFFVHSLARDHHLKYLDTTPSFAGQPPRQYHIYLTDNHPNAPAHQRYAQSLLPFLRQHHLLPP